MGAYAYIAALRHNRRSHVDEWRQPRLSAVQGPVTAHNKPVRRFRFCVWPRSSPCPNGPNSASLHCMRTRHSDPHGHTACRYKGAAAFLVLGLKNAVQFAVYEPTKRWQIARNAGGALTPLQAFLHGAFSRLVSDTVLFPARRAKVLQQRGHLIDGSSKAASSPTMVRRHSLGQREPLDASSQLICTCDQLVLILPAYCLLLATCQSPPTSLTGVAIY